MIATVAVNGKDVDIAWKPPFLVDITNAVRPGDNTIEIKVSNLWVNRLIGDEEFPDDIGFTDKGLPVLPDWYAQNKPRPQPGRKTFTTNKYYHKGDPLMPAGLVGPVSLITNTENANPMVDQIARELFVYSRNPDSLSYSRHRESPYSKHVKSKKMPAKKEPAKSQSNPMKQQISKPQSPQKATSALAPQSALTLKAGSAVVVASADDLVELFFNGKSLGKSSNWQKARKFPITLGSGVNQIALKFENASGLGGVLAYVEQDGIIYPVATQARVSTRLESGWQEANFKDAHWESPTVFGAYGIKPWKTRVSGIATDSAAEWFGNENNKFKGTVYFRIPVKTKE